MHMGLANGEFNIADSQYEFCDIWAACCNKAIAIWAMRPYCCCSAVCCSPSSTNSLAALLCAEGQPFAFWSSAVLLSTFCKLTQICSMSLCMKHLQLKAVCAACWLSPQELWELTLPLQMHKTNWMTTLTSACDTANAACKRPIYTRPANSASRH